MTIALHPRPEAYPDWDDLTQDEQEFERGLEYLSRYNEHPEFWPVFCQWCERFTFADADGYCLDNPAHTVGSQNE